jgi:dTMP kinase
LVVVEGPEGSGKSTLAKRLARRLTDAGYTVVEVREPGGTPGAEAARALVLDPAHPWSPAAELFLILAARAELVEKVIRPALARDHTVVLSDRFDLSTVAYQVAGRGLPEAEVRAANRVATGGLTPEATLVLDLAPSVGRRRQRAAGKSSDRMEQQDATMHERVARAYREAEGPGIMHLDASATPEAVEEQAWAALVSRLEGTRPAAGGFKSGGR